MKTEKISSLVLYVVFAVIILLFGVFFTYGYDNQYVANPKFNDPLMLDGVMILMYAMVAITALFRTWAVLRVRTFQVFLVEQFQQYLLQSWLFLCLLASLLQARQSLQMVM